MTEFFFTKNQLEIIRRCKEHNKELDRRWFLAYVVFPIALILITLVFFNLAAPEKQQLAGFLLNGSFPLIGLNIVFSMSGFLIKPAQLKDKGISEEVFAIKEKSNIYGAILLLLGWTAYSYQILSSLSGVLEIILITVLTGIVMIASILVGNVMFLVKDDLVEGAFDYADEVKFKKETLQENKEENDSEYQF